VTVGAAGVSGDGSVNLPQDSVSAPEILDEPGLASYTNVGAMPIGTSMTTLAVRSLTAPTDGYILAIGTSNLTLHHTQGARLNTQVRYGLTDAFPSYDTTQDNNVYIGTQEPTGSYERLVTAHGVFSATGGLTKTIRLFAQRIQGGTGADYGRTQLTLLFIPTARGTVQTIDASAEGNDVTQ
jgi:hypothetical protein